MTSPQIIGRCGLIITLWMVWSLTAFHLTSGRPVSRRSASELSTCEGRIDCGHYKALMSVRNSSRPEKVLALTNNQTHILAMKDVHEHPISLNNLFFNEKINNGVKEYYYKTFSGRSLTVDDEGHLTVEPTAASGAAKFVRYRYNQGETETPAIYLMCAYVFNETTNKNSSFLISPIRRAVKLSETSCSSEAQFRLIALDIINQGGVDLDRPQLTLEDYQFLHVQVNEPLTAKSYLSEEVLFLCRNDTNVNS